MLGACIEEDFPKPAYLAVIILCALSLSIGITDYLQPEMNPLALGYGKPFFGGIDGVIYVIVGGIDLALIRASVRRMFI